MNLANARFTLIHVKTLDDSHPNSPVVEVACLRLQNLKIVGRLHTLINPGVLIPEEFTRQTGLYSSHFEEEPALEAILPDMASFVERDVIVWTSNRANAVQKFFRLTQPRDKELFLPLLAEKIWPNDSRHHLSSLIKRCGLEGEILQRAEKTASLAAEVFFRLLQEAAEQHDIHTLPALLSFSPRAKGPSRRTRKDLPFDAARLREYPNTPGVYFMKNRLGETLYIGKAKSLRTRLRSYFQKQSRLPAKVSAMMRQVTSIDILTVGSELEALLLEAKLIKRHQPFFNRKIKDYQSMLFMKVDCGNDFPRLSVAVEADDPDAVYFGPFNGKASLENQIDTLNRIFRLRSCSNHEFAAHRDAPCMQYHVGLCNGPCAGLVSKAGYGRQVSDLLRTMQEPLCEISEIETVAQIIQRRDAYAEELQFEKAAVIQEQLDYLAWIQERNVGVILAIARHNGFIILPHTHPDARRILVVHQGVPLHWFTFHSGRHSQRDSLNEIMEIADSLLDAMNRSQDRASLPKELFEEARLLSSWLERQDPDEADGTAGQALLYPHPKNREQIIQDLTLALLDAEADLTREIMTIQPQNTGLNLKKRLSQV